MTARRLSRATLWGYLTYVMATFVAMTVVAAIRVDPPMRILSAAGAAMALGLYFSLVTVIVYAPLMWAAEKGGAPWWTPGLTAVFGAALAPAPLLVMWAIFREDNETLPGLLRFWRRVPGELVMGLTPLAAAGAVFGYAFSAPSSRRPPQGRAR